MKALSIKAILITTWLILPAMMINAQSWQWATHAGSVNYESGGPVCSDTLGNIYVFGNYFFPYAVFGQDTLVPYDLTDLYVSKLDRDGKFIWTKRAGSTGGDGSNDILYEQYSNTLITAGTIGGTNGKFINCNLGNGEKIFLAKADLEGNCVWAIGTGLNGNANSLSISDDNEGAVYMSGNLSFPAYFSNVKLDAGGFIVKFRSSDGSIIWAKRVIDENGYLSQIKYSGNRLYLGGLSVSKSLTLDKITVVCNEQDPFISKFDTSGNILWVKTMGGPYADMGGTIDLDRAGNIYTTGDFKDTAYFDNIVLTNGSKRDWYIAKYDNNGNALWARQGHITGNKVYFGFAASTFTGDIYAIGNFSGNAVFGDHSISAGSPNDMFLARYNALGQCLGITNVPNAYHSSVTFDNSENAILTGCFSGTINFGAQSIKSYGSNDIFIAKHDAITSVVPKTMANTQPQLTIYANPTTGKCTVTIPDEFLHEKQLTLQVFDFQGKQIEKTVLALADGKIRLNLEAHAKGMYQVVVDNGRKSFTGKVVFE
ncbi:MAG: T9SS type A sorting domain-containing protein [Bacteroidetes bacterium]|nr:T9SS type A sorting domain-containing protein [Bacteroidota bacterium]